MGDEVIVDLTLLDYATARQKEIITAVNTHGGVSQASRALGVARATIQAAIKGARVKAARENYAPGCDNMTKPIPEGFFVKRRSARFDKDGNAAGGWVISSPDEKLRVEAILAAIEDVAASLPRLPPLAAPAHTLRRLLNLYVFTDYHLGMRAWKEEGGADWNLEIAESMIIRAFEHMIATAPAARVGFIGQFGDFLHFDSLLSITPTNHHVLDSSSHYKQIVDAAIRIMRKMIDFALQRHEEVVVVCAEGNHDIAGGGVWLPAILKILYENEPRVTVVDNAKPYYAYEHGRTMLAVHHGHMKKKEMLPGVFAEMFSEMWGRTKKRYVHVGHFHHEVEMKDMGGMRVIQHPTLAPNDSHSARGGYSQNQQTAAITYHDAFGKVGEIVVTPEMLEPEVEVEGVGRLGLR